MKILIVQTAFIGDVILATSLIEYAHQLFPMAELHFLLRKGNESLLKDHPLISKTIVWDKKAGKLLNLLKLAWQARSEKYDVVLNIQRFASSGLFMALCGAKTKIGFRQNPFSFFFHHRINHLIPYNTNDGFLHEVQRNALLLSPLVTDWQMPTSDQLKPKLYINDLDQAKADAIVSQENYLVLAPSSVWFTKQWQKSKWIELKERLHSNYLLCFIGGPEDKDYIEQIIGATPNCLNLCGKLNLLQSAALMMKAKRVIVNDSAPLHLASSVNAKTTAIFCSTIPAFGYTPLADEHSLVEINMPLECRPCGLHGKARCPKTHFNCSNQITLEQVIATI
jgi:ADP-heptose:LPS heptosyltransferase